MKTDSLKWPVVRFVILAITIGVVYALVGTLKAQAQDQPSITIQNFKGLNTKTNPFLLEPGEFVRLNNWSLIAEYGSLVLRNGDLARTDTLSKTIPADVEWRCAVTDTATYANSDLMQVTCKCNDTLPPQDGMLDGIVVDSIFGTRPPPSGDSGVAFTIKNYLANLAADSTGRFVVDTGTVSEGVGDSIKFILSQAGFTQAVDTGGITGLYAFYKKPRTKMLLYVIPGFGSQNSWSALYASLPNTYNPTKKLADFIYKGETPQWETWNDRVYIALPRQRPLVTDGNRTVHLVPSALGQVEVVPLPVTDIDTVTFKIIGDVRYTLYSRRFFTGAVNTSLDSIKDSLNDIPGYVSHLVPYYNERGLLYRFPLPIFDSIQVAPPGNDSTLLYIAKTRGYVTVTRPNIDSFFLIGSIITDDPSILDTFKFTDSIPSDSLGSVTYPFAGANRGIVPQDSAYVFGRTTINDTSIAAWVKPDTTFFSLSAPGSPVFITRAVAAASADWWPTDTAGKGLEDHRGWRIAVTKYDTLIEVMSDKSINLIISTPLPVSAGGTDSTSSLTYGIPPLPAGDTGQVRIIWRAEIKSTAIPDSFITPFAGVTINVGPIDIGDIFGGTAIPPPVFVPEKIPVKRLEMSAFFPVGIITDKDDTSFVDNLDWDTWNGGGVDTGKVLRDRRWDPKDNRMDIVKDFFAYKNHLFANNDRRLFRSTLDTGKFLPFNDILFDPGNGDVITWVTNVGPNILVFWSNGLTEMYDPTAVLPTKGSPVQGFGCVATNSGVNYGGVAYFLARDGFRAISSHGVKKFGVGNRVISTKINDLIIDGRSDSLMSTMVGVVGPKGEDIRWSYPSIDTTFVYYPLLDEWVTRDGSFFQGTHYDTASIEGLTFSSATLVAKAGDERVFDMEVSPTYYDSGLGNVVVGVLQTAPQFTDPFEWQITALGMLRGDNSKTASVSILDDTGTVVVAGETISSTYPMYSVVNLPAHQGTFLSILYATSNIFPDITDTVRRFDLWGRRISGRPLLR